MPTVPVFARRSVPLPIDVGNSSKGILTSDVYPEAYIFFYNRKLIRIHLCFFIRNLVFGLSLKLSKVKNDPKIK